MSCPCGEGVNGDKWHRRRDEKPCAAARLAHNARRRITRSDRRFGDRPAGAPRPPDEASVGGRWIKGSSLYVPEIDPL